MDTYQEHTVTIKVWSDPRVPNWLVEKTITEAAEKVWKHPEHGHIQSEVQTFTNEGITNPLESLIRAFFKP